MPRTHSNDHLVRHVPEEGAVSPLTKERRDNATPDEILAAMRRGNRRYAEGKRITRSFLNEQRAGVNGQHPLAVLLTCIDSRAPAEIILDAGIGYILNARVAGNIANEDILGSMEFACEYAGAKVVLVMGHTKCGAIKGAINKAKLGNLTKLLKKIEPAVRATRGAGERTATNYEFVDAVAHKNVELTIDYVREHSRLLRDLDDAGKIKIAGAMYDIETALIDFF